MKLPYTLVSTVLVGLAAVASAQNFPSNIFTPSLTVNALGDNTGVLTVRANNTMNTGNTAAGQPVVWSHSAGGNIQAGLNLTQGLNLVSLDAQLFASTRTTGSSLVFGRDVGLSATLLGLPVAGFGDDLNGLLNTLVRPDVFYQWGSTATVNNLNVIAGQTYRVTFNVQPGSGIPVDALASASYGISTAGVTTVGATSGTLLNLLGAVNIGNTTTQQVFFDFVSDSNLSSVDLRFQAQSAVGANLLTGSNDYLTISGLTVAPVPEPSAAALAFAGLGAAALRRRRRD